MKQSLFQMICIYRREILSIDTGGLYSKRSEPTLGAHPFFLNNEAAENKTDRL